MKKYWILSLLFPMLMLFSCMEDTSAYLPQDKENVAVDDVDNEQGDNEDGEEVLPEGQLVPGIHLVKLNVTLPSGETEERRFKYYMPISIDASRPISLIFEFHGSWSFDAGVQPSDPIASITTSHTLIQHAIKENCVICFPAGTAEYQEDSSGAVNWANSERHLPFVDAMIEYFKERTPMIDVNRIYSTGQSSGAIFSFVLAFERSEVFAAITPRAGQMKIADDAVLPTRAVPIRVFAGTIDETVIHSAVIENMTAWAEKIGGYFPSDMVFTEDSIEIENYKKVDTRIWSGGKADYQIYSLKEEGHGISIYYCMPYMWEFMTSHTLDGASANLFITSELKEITAQCGEPISFNINYTDGATLVVEQEPQGWNMQLKDKTISLTGPKDFYGDIDRNGSIVLSISQNGESTSLEIPVILIAPKNYFEVGDIYYNENFEPEGVVCWVNNANIKEAKIISLTGPGSYGSIYYCGNGEGLGLSFDTPSHDNGYENTQNMINHNQTLTTPFTASNAAFVWAWNYGSGDGWYLPAVNELASISANVEKINATLQTLEGRTIDNNLYSSTTEVESGATTKTIYSYNFTTNQAVANKSKSSGSEYFGYVNVRAMKKVTKE